MRRALALLLVAVLAACAGGDADEADDTTGTTETSSSVAAAPESHLPWWNDRVFYEVFVRSFRDADGDGVGDLAGLTASLDYLNDGDPTTTDDLGITGLWLMPIFPSPSYHGYDVTDYRAINPDYGTMANFEAFLDAAHERGIAVLIDLVINHTSSEHPWFEASTAGDPTYGDWYLWRDTDPRTTSPWGTPVWHAGDDGFYFGLFWEGMPDLNIEHPDVTAEIHDIARFWLEDVGVDGFRIDAARHLIEDGTTMSDTPATVAWLEEFNAHVDSISPDALVLGEVWSPTATVAQYVPEALDLAFEFDLAAAGGAAVAAQDAAVLERAMGTVTAAYPELQYATFLTNHDMNRIMSDAGGDLRLAKLAGAWLLTSPGVPFVYYGEEVGLEGVKPDERIRTPMPWTAEEPGVGFTTGTPWQPPDPGYERSNVAAETDDPESLLSLYRALIQDRASSPALRRGDVVPVETSATAVTAFLRTEGDDHVLVVLNLGPDGVVDLTLDLAEGPLAGKEGVVAIAGPDAYAPEILDGGGFEDYRPVDVLVPYGFLVLRFTDEPSPPPPSTTTTTPPTTIPPAGAEDVAVVERLFEATIAGDMEVSAELLAEDATIVESSGLTYRLSDVLPPGAGADETWDWDGDGIVTVADVSSAQNAWGSLILVDFEAHCVPAGPEVSCGTRQLDVFGQAAGLDPVWSSQRFRVADGEVVELTAGGETLRVGDPRWLDQFADYERWVADTHPDLYPIVFRGPCCPGTLEGLVFGADSIAAQRTLIPEWAEG